MPYQFIIRRQVEFSETDMAGIMHYSNFFRFMESAEHGFYRSLGFSVVPRNVEPKIGFPRVHASCDFRKPARFEDILEVHLMVKEKRSKSLVYLIRFTNLSRQPVEICAEGQLTVVCVVMDKEGMKAAALPDFMHQIEPAPPDLATHFFQHREPR